jgi:hypothetical protein
LAAAFVDRRPATPAGQPICHYCDQPADPGTVPPLCPKHQDLVILVSFMQQRGETITPTSVQARYRQAKANGGLWILQEADIPAMLPDLLEAAS